MKKFYANEWSCSDKKLVTICALLLGVIIGFLFAPIKKGVYCGNNNGNTILPECEEEE